MSDDVNGHPGEGTNAPINPQLRVLQEFIGPAVTVTVKGVVNSLMAQFGLDNVMVVMCGLFGRCVGLTLSVGDLAPVLSLRKRCIDAFCSELRAVKVNPIPAGPGMSQTATAPENADLMRKLKAH